MQTSDTIQQIATAVIAAQGEMDAAKKTADNPYFKSKYADLAGCIETARPVLKTHGLGIVQSADCDGDVVVVETMLIHTSGEWMRSRTVLKPTKADPQGMGSAITYARRYAYMAIIGMAAEDDDGNAASQPTTSGTKRQAASQPETITRPQGRTNGVQIEAKRRAFFANAAKLGVDGDKAKETVKKFYNLESFNDATVDQLREAYQMIKEARDQVVKEREEGDAA